MNKEFKQYKRSNIAEMRPYEVGELLPLVSISQADIDNGSPKAGDMIARNPNNHADQWLVAEEYFKENFETIPPSSPTATAETPFSKLRNLLTPYTNLVALLRDDSAHGFIQSQLKVIDNNKLKQVVAECESFASLKEQEARRQAIDEIQTMIMQGNRAMTVVDFYDELEKLK